MAALAERAAHHVEPRHARFRALVAVGDPQARGRIVRTLAGLGAVEVVEAASVGEARIRARASGPRELLVVDLSLPDGSGLALLAELKAGGWGRGLALSSHEDPYTVRAALAAGVRCFLVEPGEDRLGERAGLTPRLRAVGVEGLSGREVEVLQRVASGLSNRDIGESLGLSALTVKSHLARIARKLGTGDRAEMVVLALRAGVIE